MKYCVHCGNELVDAAVVCPKCGFAVENMNLQNNGNAQNNEVSKSSMDYKSIAKIMMIIGTVINGFYLLPLLWCIPMTISYCNKINKGQPVDTGFKICSLIFVSLLGGIFMLMDQD